MNQQISITAWRWPLLCGALAAVTRITALVAFHSSVLFVPLESGGHDRSVYVQAIAEVANGRFFPEGAFEYLPLYPWVIGLSARALGPGPLTAALFGILFDALTTILMVSLARRLGAGHGWAVAAGVMYALYPSAVVYSLLTMPNTLNVLGVTAFVFAAHRMTAWTWRNSLLLGLLAGVAALGFAGMMLIAIAVLATAVFTGPARRGAAVLLFLIGLALPLAPVAYHNTRAEGTFVLLTTHGGFNFYMGNHERATGYPLRVRNFRMTAKSMLEDAHRHAEQESGRPLLRAESSAWWNDQARAYWQKHPGAVTGLTAKKAMLFWNHREVDDLRMREQLQITDPFFRYFHGAPFAVFGLLGLIGIFFARGAAIPRAALLAGMIGLVLFFITTRYRLTLTPLMAVMGAAAVSRLWHEGLAGRKKLAWSLVPALVVVFFPVHIRDQRPVDYYNVAIPLLTAERDTEAERVIRQGLALAPDSADLHFALGNLFYKRGKLEEAAGSYAESLTRNPHHPTAIFNLALSLARMDRYCEARDVLVQSMQQGARLDARALELLRELTSACKSNP